ncbi:hypothetical protein OK074_6463 [Actinobacteria bacterium OK074]|nr:hypothetical protein OK074_6463 [Actinobacteria bacterium OK074]
MTPPKTWEEYNDIAAKITKDAKGKYYGAIIEAQQVPVILGCDFAKKAQDPKQSKVVGKWGVNSPKVRSCSPDSHKVVRTGLAGDPLAWPTVPQAPALLQPLVDELALGLQGKQSARTALGNTQKSWEKALKKGTSG